MNLILIRHAEAVRLGEEGSTTDANRPLTDLGRTQAACLAQALATRGLVPGAIVSSGLLRANQTAEPLLPMLTREPKDLLICGYLVPEQYRPKKLTRYLLGLDQETVILVGHNPDLSTYLAWLTGAERFAFDLEKGAMALIQFEGEPAKDEGKLVALVTPSWYGAPSAG